MWSHQTNHKSKIFGPSMDDGGWMAEHGGTSKVLSGTGNEDKKATPNQTTQRWDDVVKENPDAVKDDILWLNRASHPYFPYRAKLVHRGGIKTPSALDGEDLEDKGISMTDATEARKESTGWSSAALPDVMLLGRADVPTMANVVYGGDINAAPAVIEDGAIEDKTEHEDNKEKAREGPEPEVLSASAVSHSRIRSTCEAYGVETSTFIQGLAEQRAATSQVGDEAGGGEGW